MLEQFKQVSRSDYGLAAEPLGGLNQSDLERQGDLLNYIFKAYHTGRSIQEIAAADLDSIIQFFGGSLIQLAPRLNPQVRRYMQTLEGVRSSAEPVESAASRIWRAQTSVGVLILNGESGEASLPTIPDSSLTAQLTPIEGGLLEELMKYAGRIVYRRNLVFAGWGVDMKGTLPIEYEAHFSLLKTHVSHIRTKLGVNDVGLIDNVPLRGYILHGRLLGVEEATLPSGSSVSREPLREEQDCINELLSYRGPQLNSDQETSLSRDIDTAKLRMESAKSLGQRDDEAEVIYQHARETLARSHVDIVVTYLQPHFGDKTPISKLIEAGVGGLMKAADKFDDRRGFPFSTYAAWWVREAVSKTIESYGNDEVDQGFRLREEFMSQQNREKLMQIMNISRQPLSLDVPINEDGTTREVSDPSASLDELFDSVEVEGKAQQAQALFRELLSEHEYEVMKLSWGLEGESAYGPGEVAKRLGISPKEVYKLRQTANRKIGKSVQARLLISE